MQDAYKRAGCLSTRDEMTSTRQSERAVCGQCQGGVGRGHSPRPRACREGHLGSWSGTQASGDRAAQIAALVLCHLPFARPWTRCSLPLTRSLRFPSCKVRLIIHRYHGIKKTASLHRSAQCRLPPALPPLLCHTHISCFTKMRQLSLLLGNLSSPA